MSRKLSSGIILLLIITNIVTLIFWRNDGGGHNKTPTVDNGDGQQSVEETLATVGDKTITYDEWIEALKGEQGKRQLKNMIDREVVQQLAEEKNIQVNDKLVDREMALLMTMEGVMTEDEIEKEEEKLRTDIEHRYLLEALLADGTSVSEDDVRTYYDNYHNQYNFSASIQFSHIIVDDMDTAEKVITELDDGASFQLLAQEYSTDDETKDQGGYLGFYSTTSQFMPSGYSDVAEDMDEHTYSEPFQVGDDVAIIYLHRTLPAYEFEYDEIKDHIKNELALNELEQSLTVDPLWDELDIDWIYDK